MALFIVTDFLTIVKKGDGKLNKKKRQASFKKLDTLIKARNVSFYKLSEELGMARSTFSDWKSGKSMPKTDKLIKIANYFGVEVSYFIEQKGKKELVDILKKTFTVYSSLEWQNDITAFNWKRIYTSNYDNVIEIASNVAHKHRPAISISSKEETQATNIKDGVVHLNGFIDDITEDNLDNSTKLTSSSYTDTNFLDSSWKTEFDIDLEHSKAVFFIGFSLNYDLDLKRIIASNKEYKKKIFFIIF